MASSPAPRRGLRRRFLRGIVSEFDFIYYTGYIGRIFDLGAASYRQAEHFRGQLLRDRIAFPTERSGIAGLAVGRHGIVYVGGDTSFTEFLSEGIAPAAGDADNILMPHLVDYLARHSRRYNRRMC